MARISMDGMTILMVFIGVIITATFIVPIANQVIGDTTIISAENTTITLGAVNTSVDLAGRGLNDQTFTITNATEVSPILTILTVTDGFNSQGLRSVQVVVNDTADTQGYATTAVNVSYNYQPEGYINGSGARSVSLLVILFGVLSIVIFTIISFIKTGSLGVLMKMR